MEISLQVIRSCVAPPPRNCRGSPLRECWITGVQNQQCIDGHGQPTGCGGVFVVSVTVTVQVMCLPQSNG